MATNDSDQPITNTQELPTRPQFSSSLTIPQRAILKGGRDTIRGGLPSISVGLAQRIWAHGTRIPDTIAVAVTEPPPSAYRDAQDAGGTTMCGVRHHQSQEAFEKWTPSNTTPSSAHTSASSLSPPALIGFKPEDGDQYHRRRRPPHKARHQNSRSTDPVEPAVEGWTEFIHPDGGLYYTTVVGQVEYGKSITLVTHCQLRVAENRLRMKQAMEELEDLLDGELADIVLPSIREACLLLLDDDKNVWGYYMVDHEAQNVFFAGSVSIEAIGPDVREHVNFEHVDTNLTIEYWRHIADYPCHASISEKSWDDLSLMMAALAVAFPPSTASSENMKIKLQRLYLKAKSLRVTASNRTSFNWATARLWYELLANYPDMYVSLFQGTSSGGDSVDLFGPPDETSSVFLEWICYLTMWNQPMHVLKELDQAWIGSVLDPKEWERVMIRFNGQWETVAALGAVSFAGALAFLALCTPGIANQPEPHSNLPVSFSQLCGILSCVFSITGFISTLFLRVHFSGAFANNVDAAKPFLLNICRRRHGYLQLGISFAMPKGLVLWSIVFFCLGVLFLALEMHRYRMGFFDTEVAVAVPLIAILKLQRRLSPQHLRGSPSINRKKHSEAAQGSTFPVRKSSHATKRRTTATAFIV